MNMHTSVTVRLTFLMLLLPGVGHTDLRPLVLDGKQGGAMIGNPPQSKRVPVSGFKATACLFGPNPANSWSIVLLSHSVPPIPVKVLFYLPLNVNKNISTYTPPVHIGTLA